MNVPRNVLLFTFACVPARVGLVVGSFLLERSTTVTFVPFIVAACMISLGFAWAHIVDASEGFFGGTKYWDGLAHAIIYALYAALLADNTGVAYTVLIADLVFGVITFVLHYT